MVMDIQLTKGYKTKVSDHRFEQLSKQKWYAMVHRGQVYACRKVTDEHGTKHTIYMHRLILGTPDGVNTDHINGDSLDNQDDNLRQCDTSQNGANLRRKGEHSSTYKGVSWDTERKKWLAQICLKKKRINIGRFATEIEAAKAYDAKAKELFGEYAHLNFPTSSSR